MVMGSCVSRSSSAPTTTAESERALSAKVVGLDGSMAQFAAPVTAHEALATARRASSHFVCCADELYFDALQAGQLYFFLPLSMLRRPLSGQDMAALAVKASAALGAAPVVADRGTAAAGPSRYKSRGGAGAAGNKQRRRQTGRVAPLDVESGGGSGRADGEWKNFHHVYGDRTVGKTRNGDGYKGVTPRLPAVQRLSVVVEAASE